MALKTSTKPGGFIDFEIVGDRHGVQQMLEVVDTALSPIGLAAFLYGVVGPWVQERAQERFTSEGDDVSGKWAPLKDVTVKIRESAPLNMEDGSHPINKRTGELEEYITQGGVDVVSAPGAAVLKFPGKEVKTKSLREKLKTAQQGRTSPSTVARPVLGLNERDLAYTVTMLAFHVQGEGVSRGFARS